MVQKVALFRRPYTAPFFPTSPQANAVVDAYFSPQRKGCKKTKTKHKYLTATNRARLLAPPHMMRLYEEYSLTD